MRKKEQIYLLPYLLSVVIVITDQLSKSWIINHVPVNTIYKNIGNDLVWICHVRNTGVAFSMGAGSSTAFRILFFIVLPVLIMSGIAFLIGTKKNYLTNVQRWMAAGILGGGAGTIIDRVFRFSDGVVDFISVRFFGIFGLDRWPTFNVSDSCVVVFVILFAIAVLFTKEEKKK